MITFTNLGHYGRLGNQMFQIAAAYGAGRKHGAGMAIDLSITHTSGQGHPHTKDDKNYVMSLIQDIRKHNFKKLAPEDGHCCNGLWRKYS